MLPKLTIPARLILLLVFMLLASSCLTGTAHAGQGPDKVINVLVISVSGADVFVDQEIRLGAIQSRFLRGAPALNPSSLENLLADHGYQQVRCQVGDTNRGIQISCSYCGQLLTEPNAAVQQFKLPGDELLSILTVLPVEAAQALRIETRGEIHLEGIILSLPADDDLVFQDGGAYVRRYSLALPKQVVVEGDDLVVPGQTSLYHKPVIVTFAPAYPPEPLTWLVFALALSSVIAAVVMIFPVQISELQNELRPPQGNLAGILKKLWPFVTYLVSGLTPMALGGLALYLAYRTFEQRWFGTDLQGLLEWLVANLRLSFDPAILSWQSWLVLLIILGVGLLGLGIGLWLRNQAARYTAAGLLLAILVLLVWVWANALLMPPLIPYQVFIVFVAGEVCLATCASLYRALTHPDFRHYYQTARR